MFFDALAPHVNRRLLRFTAMSALLATQGCLLAADDDDDRGHYTDTSRRPGQVRAGVADNREVDEREVVVEEDPARVAPVLGPSSLVVDWTIDDTKDPFECQQGDVSDIEIVLTDTATGVSETYLEACESFATEIELAPGDYDGEASLVTPLGEYRTTAVGLGLIATFEDEQSEVFVNFPADSFL
jgi:hypothetical protein